MRNELISSNFYSISLSIIPLFNSSYKLKTQMTLVCPLCHFPASQGCNSARKWLIPKCQITLWNNLWRKTTHMHTHAQKNTDAVRDTDYTLLLYWTEEVLNIFSLSFSLSLNQIQKIISSQNIKTQCFSPSTIITPHSGSLSKINLLDHF